MRSSWRMPEIPMSALCVGLVLGECRKCQCPPYAYFLDNAGNTNVRLMRNSWRMPEMPMSALCIILGECRKYQTRDPSQVMYGN
jgi:hypothetical protein